MFIHTVACVRISFLRLSNILWYVYAAFCLSIYLLKDIWLAFYLLVIISNSAMNTSIQVSVQGLVFTSFVCIPRSGIAGFYGNFTFNFFLKNHHIIFHSNCSI